MIKRRLTESAVKEAAHGQRVLLLPRIVAAHFDEDKKSRPPVSYNPPATANDDATLSGRAVIPPIRSFRSSESRKSAVLDMPGRHTSGDSYNEDALDPNQRDRALRTLEGRHNEDFSPQPPSDPGEMTTTTDNDNTADIFMKIAREDPVPRASEKQGAPAEPSVVVSSLCKLAITKGSPTNTLQSRVARAAHRRPFSTSTPAYDMSSPPRLSRRLSDQRDGSRSRQTAESQPPQSLTRESSYRTPGRENLPPLATSADNSSRSQAGRSSMRPSPVTPKQISFKDSLSESSSAYQRRRQSLTENNSSNNPSPRVTQYRNANLVMTQARTYHSSPLVPKSTNVLPDGSQPHSSETNHGVEGTESSSSTAAPSTVWDELDDLKSRIHRLERTGKMPPASGGGMSRSSDERPRTATTNATTVSASPKRGSGPGSSHAEGHSNSTSLVPREAQPLLLSALSKTKSLVKPDVFTAIESAATDAMALSSLIGSIGQPGPISSSASTIGGYNGSVTDRQLRKKADSICRSLTELCLALADPTDRKKEPQQAMAAALEQGAMISPTTNSPSLEVVAPQRRPSAVAETVIKQSTSPRAPTSLEQKRKTMLASISLPTSRYTTAPTTPLESTAGRKSSLLLARIRRTATEEPEEEPQAGRRSSLLLRSRRNDSEEPEETRGGRKTSLLLRSRKPMSDDEDDSRARGPSRAVTEMNNFRMNPRESTMALPNHHQPSSEVPATPSALPRRRMIPSAIATRLAAAIPSASTPTTPARKYLERTSLPERGTPQERGGGAYQERGAYLDRSTHQERAINNLSERLAEERGQQQRQASLGQSGMLLNRSGSLGRRTRETGIPSLRS